MLSCKALVFSTVFALLVLLAAPLSAQDPRGSIAGTVTDATGGVLPGVTVTVTNTETGVAQNAVTDGEGRYRVLYLNPGTYSVTAELSGFKKFVRGPDDVSASATSCASTSRSRRAAYPRPCPVTADTPLLNTSTGISGTTVDSKQIAELPLGDGTAYMLTRLAPGIVDSSDLHFSRPMDNGNLAGIVANGVQGGNEFTIDGAPNMSNARGVGFSPPSDAIARVQGADERVRRADRAHRRRGREPRAEERHQRASTARAARTSTATTAARRRRCSPSAPAARSRRASTTATPARSSGPDRPQPDVLHGARSSTCATCSPSRRPTPCRP